MNSKLTSIFSNSLKSGLSEDFTSCLNEISHRLPQEIEVTVPPQTFDVSGDLILIGTTKGNVMIYDIRTDEIVKEVDRSNSAIHSVVLSSDKKLALTSDVKGSVSVLSFPDLILLSSEQLFKHPVTIRVLPNNVFVASTRKNQLFEIRYESKLSISPLVTFQAGVETFAVNQDEIAAGLFTGEVIIFNVQNPSSQVKLSPESDDYRIPITQIACSPIQKYVAAALENTRQVLEFNHSISVWNNEGKCINILRYHTDSITGLQFARGDTYLISSSKDSNILIWNLSQSTHLMNLKLYDSPVTNIYTEGETLISSQENNMILIWTIPEIAKYSKYERHESDITEIEFYRNGRKVITADAEGTLIIWDYEHDQIVYEACFMQKLITFSISVDCSMCLISTEEPCLYRLDLADYSSSVVMSDCFINSIKFHSNEKTVLTGDSKNRLIEWELPNLQNYTVMKGHFKQITVVSGIFSKNLALTGSKDTFIRLWDLNKHEFIAKFSGHTDTVTAVRSGNTNIIYSSSLDGTIRLWDILTRRLMYTLEVGKPILNMKLYKTERYMMSIHENSLVFWDVAILTKVTETQFSQDISCVNRSDHFGIIGVTCGNILYLLSDPILSNSFDVIGLHTEYVYQYMKYVKNKLTVSDNLVEHRDEFNDLVIVPYLINTMHVCVAANDSNQVKKSLRNTANPASIFHTRSEISPVKLSVDLKYLKCTDVVLKYMARQSTSNKKILSPLSDLLRDLNSLNLKYLTELYSYLLRKSHSSSLISSIPASNELPLYAKNNSILIFNDNFNIDNKPQEEITNIEFKTSLVQLSLVEGSQDSINLLKSLRDAPQQKILESELVQYVLHDKWRHLKFIMYTQAAIYAIYAILLVLYAFNIEDIEYFIPLLVFHIFLCVIEIMNMLCEKRDYFMSKWNITDLVRTVLFFVYIGVFDGSTGFFEVVFLLLVFVSAVKGLTYFRIFKATRYAIQLISVVINDIQSFLILLFYSLFLFGLILSLMPASSEVPNFSSSFTLGFRIAIGDYDTSEYEFIDWLFFTLAILLTPIVMLNLLIAIMTDTHEKVQNIYLVADRLELLDMLIETEYLLFWNRSKSHKSYFQICLREGKFLDQEWTGKIKELKKVIKKSARASQHKHSELVLSYEKMNKGMKECNDQIYEIIDLIKSTKQL